MRDEDDFRYTRVGYIPREEATDKFISQILKSLPGDGVLPLHWKYVSAESFQRRFGALGTILWSKTASYHMLMVSGTHVCRIWTNAKHFSIIDVTPSLAVFASAEGLKVSKIPENSLIKTKPMEDRVFVSTEEEMVTFIDCLVRVHGLQDWVK